jgi:3-oxoacyl-[acyl-carrier protein] reductase
MINFNWTQHLGIKERVALVTGSSQGIGRATAELFGSEGAYVVVTYRNNRDKAEAVAATIRGAGGNAMVVFFDLASGASIDTAVAEVLAQWGRIDILVNNAVAWGDPLSAQTPPFEGLPVEEWQPLMRANLEGAFRTIQAVVPSMRERHWGRIVNISSDLAADGMPGAGWYTTVKAGLHGLTRTLAKELAPDGILTNVIMPGLTLTERATVNIPAAVLEEVARKSPIRRILPPAEVAPMIVFLCSSVNTSINGEIIRASGGIA